MFELSDAIEIKKQHIQRKEKVLSKNYDSYDPVEAEKRKADATD